MIHQLAKRTKDFNAAISNLNYAKVQQMLADPTFEVNFCLKGAPLPLDTMLSKGNARLARLFLECERVDWLAPAWDRSLHEMQQRLGIQYEATRKVNKKRPDYIISSPTGYFYELDYRFLASCPQEAELVYEKIVGEIAKAAEPSNFDAFVCNEFDSLPVFKSILRHCPDVYKRKFDGSTLLHRVKSGAVAALLVELGADVNALNEQNETPLMTKSNDLRYGGCLGTLLLEKGAKVNLKGLSPRAVCRFLQCARKGMIPFDMEELKSIFLSTLKDLDASIYCCDPELIFRKFPELTEIFKSQLPHSLRLVENFYETCYFRNMREEEQLWALKRFVVRRKHDCLSARDDTVLSVCRDLLQQHANEIFHEACKYQATLFLGAIVHDFQPDVNGVFDGVFPLFVAHVGVIDWLLERGADPLRKVNDYFFFELNEQLKTANERTCCHFPLTLHKRGFDVFKPASRTVKSLMDCISPKALFEFHFEDCVVSMPFSRVTRQTLQVLSQYVPDCFAPLDADRNTILHYVAGYYERFLRQEKSFYLERIPLADWKRVRNRARKTPYDLMIENENFYQFLPLISDFEKARAFLEDCASVHGQDIFMRYGGQMLLDSLHAVFKTDCLTFPLTEYLIDERGVALERLLCREKERKSFTFDGMEENVTIADIIADKLLKGRLANPELLLLMADRSKKLTPKLSKLCFSLGNERVWEALGNKFARTGKELAFFLKHLAKRKIFNNDRGLYAYLGFLKKRFGAVVLKRNYLRICTSRRKVRIMHYLELDGRDLIGTNEHELIIPDSLGKITGHAWNEMRNYGWTVKHFQRLGVCDLLRQKSSKFAAAFPEEPKK